MRLTALCILCLLMLSPVASGQPVPDSGLERIPTSRMEMLIQRAARQYLMYQYGLAELDGTREPLLQTVAQVNEALRRLRSGETMVGVEPINEAGIRKQLGKIDARWRPLERIYTYQPYKLFEAKELLPPAVRKEDPVLVRYVDRLSQDALAEVDRLIELYRNYCELTDTAACNELVRETGREMMLIESVARDVLFVVLGLDVDARRAQLSELVAELEPRLQAMSSPERFGGAPPGLIGPVAQTVLAYWQQMEVSVDLALSGDAEDVDVDQFLRSEAQLIDELDNLSVLLAGR